MEKRIVLTNCSIIDVKKGTVEHNKAILIEEKIIKKIEKEGDFNIDAEIIDMKGLYLLPAFSDLHTHISFEGSASSWSLGSILKEKTSLRAIRASKEAFKYIESGFVNIRDLGSMDYIDIGVKEAIEAGIIEGPRIFASGKALSITGGHGDLWLREDVEYQPFGILVDGVDEVIKTTRKIIKQGADWIKILATGGVASEGDLPEHAQYSLEEMRAAVEIAHAAKRKVAVHAHGWKGIDLAIKAGVDTIEHGSMLAEKEDLATEMKKNNIALVPTVAVINLIIERGPKEGLPGYAIEKAEKIREIHKESLRIAKKNGVKIALGTDSGYIIRHGESAYEFFYLVKYGLSNLEAIQAATINAAEVLGISDRYGSIEEGKLADLLAIEGNPLGNIEILLEKNRIKLVMKEGKILFNNLI